MDGEPELAHDGTERLERFESADRDEVVVVGADIGVVAGGTESRQVEGDAQVVITGLGQARFLVDTGAGLVLPRIEASHGNPLLGAHVIR